MRAFVHSIGIAIRNEYLLKSRFDDSTKRMVYDPVTKGGCADFSLLGFMNVKMRIGAGRITAIHQRFVQLQQVIHQLKLEGGHIYFAALACRRTLECLQKMRQAA